MRSLGQDIDGLGRARNAFCIVIAADLLPSRSGPRLCEAQQADRASILDNENLLQT